MYSTCEKSNNASFIPFTESAKAVSKSLVSSVLRSPINVKVMVEPLTVESILIAIN